MKKTIFQGVKFLVAGCMIGITSNAQAVTLDEVLQDVVATNPVILEEQKAYNAALAKQKDVRGGYFPKVIFSGGIGYKAYRDSGTRYTTDDDGFYDARLTVSQLLFDWGKTCSLETAHKYSMLSALYSYIGEASQVTYDTIVAYLDVLKYNELRELAMQNVVTHENLLASIEMQVNQGKKGRSELERISGRMAAAQSRLLLRQNDYKRALYTLHKLLGRFTPVDEMAMPHLDIKELPGSLKEALDLQVQYHPLLREAFYNIAQKEEERNHIKAASLGRLSLEGVLSIEDEFDNSDDYESEASVALRYRHTLFDAGRSHRVQAAVSDVHKEQQKGYQVRRTLLNDIQLSWAAHKLLTEQIGVLKKNLYFTRRSLESYKEEFVLGRQTLINILNAQNENQYVNEQLIDAFYSREMEKYKILLSEGVLLTKLGLLNPMVQAMLEQDPNYVPLSSDVLPLNHDFDKDGVADQSDVSVNSKAQDAVNSLGISKSYNSGYIYQKNTLPSAVKEQVIETTGSLKETPLELNVSTRFNFDAFVAGSLQLSKTLNNKMMRDLVAQARSYSTKTPLYITVSSNEYDNETQNYALSLQRAYNLKRILQRNQINEKGIFVFANSDAPKGHNILRIRFTDLATDYQQQYSKNLLNAKIFVPKENRLAAPEKLAQLITAIKENSGKAEIVLFSNELADKEANRQLGLQRAKLLTSYLAEQGLGQDKVVVFPWGGFNEDPLLPKSRQVGQFLQYVLRK